MSKKDLIAETARRLFATKGYDGTCVDEIASEANVNKATIYYYFKNKKELYQASVEDSISRVLKDLKGSIRDSKDPENSIKTYINSFYKHSKNDQAFLRILMREVASGGERLSDKLIGIFVDILKILETILEDGFRNGVFKKVDTKMVHFSVIGSISFYICSKEMRERFRDEVSRLPSFLNDEDRDVNELCELILRGLKK